MKLLDLLATLDDDDLMEGLGRVAGRRRRVEAELCAHLAEVDKRELYREHACSHNRGSWGRSPQAAVRRCT